MGAEVTQISAFTTAAAHTLCFACLAVAHSLAGRGALVSDPALALRLVVVRFVPLLTLPLLPTYLLTQRADSFL
jgi:phosphatidylinositol glycan class F